MSSGCPAYFPAHPEFQKPACLCPWRRVVADLSGCIRGRRCLPVSDPVDAEDDCRHSDRGFQYFRLCPERRSRSGTSRCIRLFLRNSQHSGSGKYGYRGITHQRTARHNDPDGGIRGVDPACRRSAQRRSRRCHSERRLSGSL